MGTVNGVTASKAAEIEAAIISGGSVVGDNLILEKFDTSILDLGPVKGPQGPQGDGGAPGVNGVSVPIGGLTEESLVKVSNTDHDTGWGTTIAKMTVSTRVLYQFNPDHIAGYTLGIDDAEQLLLVSSFSGDRKIRVTVPTNEAVPFIVGTKIRVAQANQTDYDFTLAAADGVEVIFPENKYPILKNQYAPGGGSIVEFIKIDDDTWLLDSFGNLRDIVTGPFEYEPEFLASTTNPYLGSLGTKGGIYTIDKMKFKNKLVNRVHGGVWLHFKGDWISYGSGRWSISLPVPGVNYDNRGFSLIGNCVILNVGLNNFRSGALLFDGFSKKQTHAVVAINSNLWMSHNVPFTSPHKIWCNFSYQAA